MKFHPTPVIRYFTLMKIPAVCVNTSEYAKFYIEVKFCIVSREFIVQSIYYILDIEKRQTVTLDITAPSYKNTPI